MADAGLEIRGPSEIWNTIVSVEARDSETWRHIKALWVRDGETWRQIAGFTETLYPTSDIETTGWSTTPLWSKLDDESEVDSIVSDTTLDSPSPETFDFECALGDPSYNHLSGEQITIRVRARKVEVGSTEVDLTAKLYEGSTVITTKVWYDIGTTYTTLTYDLLRSSIESITDWTNLDLQLSVTQTVYGEGDDVYTEVAWMQLKFNP